MANTRNKKLKDLEYFGYVIDNKIQNGICKHCQNLRIKSSRYCLYHHIKLQCNTAKIDRKLIIPLMNKLYAQKFKCAYSGILIIPGIN